MTADGLRLLQDLRRSLLEPPHQLRPRPVTAAQPMAFHPLGPVETATPVWWPPMVTAPAGTCSAGTALRGTTIR